MKIRIQNVSHVLLDIEGTTCPVSFVASTLFPYASKHLAQYLENHQHEPDVISLMNQVDAHQMTCSPSGSINPASLSSSERAWLSLGERAALSFGERAALSSSERVAYLQSLIEADAKLTALKDLQGRIWEEGYQQGELISPLFDDVAPNLRRWQRMGIALSVYSSGSVAAQKLLYQYSNCGDLSDLFSNWFDTNHGPKKEAASYRTICQAMAVKPLNVLFLSDNPAELRAAESAGLQAVCTERPGNHKETNPYRPSLQSLDELDIL